MTPLRRLSLATSLAVLLLSVGCTAPPEKELLLAEGALETARAASAPRYAPDEFGAADAAMARAKTAVAERDYKLALNHALDARELALNAVRAATEARARARGAIEQQIADIETLRRTLDARVADAATAKVGRQALAAATSASARVRQALAEVRPLLDQGADDKAVALLTPLADQLTTATSEIDAAITERNSRRPARRTRR